MRRNRDLHFLIRPVLGLALAAVAAFAGCSDDDDDNPVNPGPGSTSFAGIFASGTSSGTMTATIGTSSLAPSWGSRARSVSVTASGVIDVGAANVNLTGSYDNVTDSLNLSGGGYTFLGTYEASGFVRPSLIGSWTGPGGPDDRGEFVLTQGATGTQRLYCGIFRSTDSPPDSGTFSFAIRDTVLAGVAHPSGAEAGVYFEGTVGGSGNPRTITIDYEVNGEYALFAPGVLDTASNNISGTYSFTDIAGDGAGDDEGTWSGALCE